MMHNVALRAAGGSLLVALLLAVTAAEAVAGGKWKWWRSEQFQREMALSADQIARIDKIFEDTWPTLHAQKAELDRLETELSQAIAEGTADERRVVRLIDRVETSRGELGRTRSLMLFRMHRVLTADQRKILKTLQQIPESTRTDGHRPR